MKLWRKKIMIFQIFSKSRAFSMGYNKLVRFAVLTYICDYELNNLPNFMENLDFNLVES